MIKMQKKNPRSSSIFPSFGYMIFKQNKLCDSTSQKLGRGNSGIKTYENAKCQEFPLGIYSRSVSLGMLAPHDNKVYYQQYSQLNSSQEEDLSPENSF